MPFSSPQMQRRWKALPGEPVGDAGDVYTGYDRFGRVERMRWGKVGDGGSFTPLVDVGWGYSPASQKTWRKDVLAPATTQQDQKFDYDALYQLTQRQRGLLNVNMTSAGGVPAQQEDFDYDETGNWKGYRQSNGGALSIDQGRVNNRSNQVTQVDGSSAGISHDANGNMLTVPTGDALTDPSNRIVWDGWNRPVRVYDAAENLLAEYRYDGLGRRVTVTSGGSIRHTYYDDQWRSIEERLDSSTTAERQHVWHPADRWEMILRDRSTANNGVMDERLYPMKDQLDPVAIADDTGSVVERFSYSAFGIPTFLDSSFSPQSPAHAWNFLFHAEFQDAETGWFNYGYRYYDPQLGRWLSRDPIGERGGMILYGFTQNSAPNGLDYLGEKPTFFWDACKLGKDVMFRRVKVIKNGKTYYKWIAQNLHAFAGTNPICSNSKNLAHTECAMIRYLAGAPATGYGWFRGDNILDVNVEWGTLIAQFARGSKLFNNKTHVALFVSMVASNPIADPDEPKSMWVLDQYHTSSGANVGPHYSKVKIMQNAGPDANLDGKVWSVVLTERECDCTKD